MNVSVTQQNGLSISASSALRYLGGRLPDDLLPELNKALALFSRGIYRICYAICPVIVCDGTLSFGDSFSTASASLAENLRGCDRAALFCATLGAEADRKIRSQRLSPAAAVVWDAAATAAIEQLCDDFCEQLPKPQRPRFSPGYGDLPLDTQQALLALLQAELHVGVCLTDSLLMTPTKSVTAIVGLSARTNR